MTHSDNRVTVHSPTLDILKELENREFTDKGSLGDTIPWRTLIRELARRALPENQSQDFSDETLRFIKKLIAI